MEPYLSIARSTYTSFVVVADSPDFRAALLGWTHVRSPWSRQEVIEQHRRWAAASVWRRPGRAGLCWLQRFLRSETYVPSRPEFRVSIVQQWCIPLLTILHDGSQGCPPPGTHTCVVSSHTRPGVIRVIKRIWQRWWRVTSKVRQRWWRVTSKVRQRWWRVTSKVRQRWWRITPKVRFWKTPWLLSWVLAHIFFLSQTIHCPGNQAAMLRATMCGFLC